MIQGDVDGDGHADFLIHTNEVLVFTAADFIL